MEVYPLFPLLPSASFSRARLSKGPSSYYLKAASGSLAGGIKLTEKREMRDKNVRGDRLLKGRNEAL